MRIACLWFREPVDVKRLAEDCLRFTPQICLRESDAIFLEIGKCYRLYSEETFIRRASALIRKLNLPALIGLADSIEWALVHAKYQSQDLQLLSLHSLFELSDPLNRDSRAHDFVVKLVAALEQVGIRNLAQFKAIPRRELAARFGPVGLLCRQRLGNELTVPWKPWLPPETISESMEYLYSDFQGAVEPLLFEAKKLLDKIFARLRSRGLKAAALELIICCEKLSINPERERKLKLEFLLPQADTKGTLAILREFFGKEFGRRPLLSPLENSRSPCCKPFPASWRKRTFTIIAMNERKPTRRSSLSLPRPTGKAASSRRKRWNTTFRKRAGRRFPRQERMPSSQAAFLCGPLTF